MVATVHGLEEGDEWRGRGRGVAESTSWRGFTMGIRRGPLERVGPVAVSCGLGGRTIYEWASRARSSAVQH